MKSLHRAILMLTAAVLAALILLPPAFAQRGYGMHQGMMGYGDSGGGWQYCPYCGSRFDSRDDDGWRPGYHHRGGSRWGPGGYGQRPHMVWRGYGPGYEDRDDRGYRRDKTPLDEKEAKTAVSDMLERSRNPNLKVGSVEDKNDFFIVDILTKNGVLVDKMQVDKETGMMRSQY